MAFYLDRTFRNDDRMLILHDVHLALGSDHAQIDHLVVHPFGVAIVESKSVTSSVRINAADEWERAWNGRWQGMPDPLLQGERQGILLKRLLQSRTADLLDKAIFGLMQGTFTHMAMDVFAAVSDTGTIKRSRKGQAPHAMKADAIPNAIVETVEGHRRDGALPIADLKAFGNAPRSFKVAEQLRVAHFLRVHSDARRQPAAPSAIACEAAPIPPPVTRPASGPADAGAGAGAPRVGRSSRHRSDAPADIVSPATAEPAAHDHVVALACKKCGSHDMEALIGRFGPYGHCRACDENTSVRPTCTACGEKVRVQRSPEGFAGTCGECGTAIGVRVGATEA